MLLANELVVIFRKLATLLLRLMPQNYVMFWLLLRNSSCVSSHLWVEALRLFQTRRWQTMAYRPNLAYDLFLYGSQVKNGLYIFKGSYTTTNKSNNNGKDKAE